MKKRGIALSVLLILTIVLSACGTKEPEDTPPAVQENNVVRLAMRMPGDLNPLTSPWESCRNTFLLIYDGLFRESDTQEAVPQLAESYSVLSDGLEVMINLRKDVSWHDGKPFTADDVVYTLETIKNAEESAFAENVEAVVSWTKIDDYTVELFLSEPCGTVVHQLTFPIISAHFDDYEHSAVGTGPFRVESFDTQEALTLAANQDYFLGAPKLSGAIVQFVRTDDMDTAAFTSHSSDVISARIQEKAPFSPGERMKYVSFPSTELVYMGMNTERWPFASALTRQALAHLIDRDSVVEQDYTEKALAAPSALSSVYPYYEPEISAISYDVEEAREGLFHAGWSDLDGDGVIDVASGGEASVEMGELTPFIASVLVNEEDVARTIVADRLVRAMLEVGINAWVEAVPYEQYAERIEEGHFDMYVGKVRFPSVLDMGDLLGSGGSVNYSGYVSEDLDSLLAAMAKASDDLSRRVSAEEFQTHFAEEMPILPICFLDSGWYVWDNVEFHAEGYQNPFACSHLWTKTPVEAKEQPTEEAKKDE